MKSETPKKEPSDFSIKKRLKSFEYAGKGIRSFVLSTPNAWIHLTVAVIVIAAGFYFKLSIIEWIGIVLSIGMVLSAEALNTAVEEWVDVVKPEFDKKAGNVKDIAAGAVLMTAICATVIGLLIFLPKIIALF